MKTMLLLCALVVGSMNGWATDVTINFGTDANDWAAHTTASYTDSDSRTWSRTYSAGSKSSGQADYSQFGNSSNACTSLILTATAGSDMTVTAFSVKMVGASGGTSPTTGTIYLYKKSGDTETQLATASVSGTTDVTCQISSSVTFSSTDVLKVSYVGTAKAIRIKQLSYSYTTSGGGGGGSSVSAPTFSPAAGAVAAGTEVSILQAEADAIRYTTDGTDPSKTTGTVYEDTPITITAATTIKAIAIKGDDVSPVATADYTITVAAPVFSLDGGSYLEGTSVTITSAGNTIYYTTDGSTTPSKSSTEYTGPISIAAGKTTYKAIAYDAYGNASGVITRTYTGITPTSLPFSWTGTSDKGKEDLANQTGVEVNLASNYAGSNAPHRLKFDGTSKYVMIYTDEKPEVVSFTARIFEVASTGSKMKVQASADGSEFRDIQEFTIKGDKDQTFEFTTTNAFASTDRVIKLALSYKDKNVGVGTIRVSCVPVTITTAEYATFVSDKATDFSATGITVYTATDEETQVQLNEVTSGKIPANTPVVLYKAGADGTAVNVPVIATAEAPTGTNDLRVSTGTDVENMYVLSKKNDKVGFRVWNGSSDLSAGKVYLLGKASYGAREFIGFDDDVTAIEAVKTQNVENGQFFNLAGQRVAQPTKGLYIVNGKKVIIK